MLSFRIPRHEGEKSISIMRFLLAVEMTNFCFEYFELGSATVINSIFLVKLGESLKW